MANQAGVAYDLYLDKRRAQHAGVRVFSAKATTYAAIIDPRNRIDP